MKILKQYKVKIKHPNFPCKGHNLHSSGTYAKATQNRLGEKRQQNQKHAEKRIKREDKNEWNEKI